MNFLGTIVLMLLTLVGYSSGAVIAGRGEKKLPELFDLGMVVLLLAVALGTSAVIGRQIIIPLWFILSGLVSALVTKSLYRDGRIQKGAKPALVENGSLEAGLGLVENVC